jgi:uncharacterized protein YdhG (YjbR/CyaY superfamily)
MTKPENFEEYIIPFPAETQKQMEQIRTIIKEAAPQAEEVISYGMPSFRLNGRLLYFAAYRNHIGFYPMASAIEAFKSSLSDYKWAKGSIQFPLSKPVPVDLISDIVKFRVQQNLAKAYTGSKKKLKNDDFLSILPAPARSALENNGITTLKQLSGYTEKEIQSFHGLGPGSIPKLKAALKLAGLSFNAE